MLANLILQKVMNRTQRVSVCRNNPYAAATIAVFKRISDFVLVTLHSGNPWRYLAVCHQRLPEVAASERLPNLLQVHSSVDSSKPATDRRFKTGHHGRGGRDQ